MQLGLIYVAQGKPSEAIAEAQRGRAASFQRSAVSGQLLDDLAVPPPAAGNRRDENLCAARRNEELVVQSLKKIETPQRAPDKRLISVTSVPSVLSDFDFLSSLCLCVSVVNNVLKSTPQRLSPVNN